MEPNCENKPEESFLKIGTIWSEAEENYESITVKEEIVSDIEPECIFSAQENGNSDAEHQTGNNSGEDKYDDGICNPVVTSWQSDKNNLKSKILKVQSEEDATIDIPKPVCLHDSKNFKIIKTKLRCGDCRSLMCPECSKGITVNLQNHFLGSDVKSIGFYSCRLCRLVFNSLCALQAHFRIHMMTSPYVCPDCGLIYNDKFFLYLHLINKCFHVYKIVRNKCKNCPGTYFTPDHFTTHIETQHVDFIIRCSNCSSVFNNSEEFNSHAENAHQKQKVQPLSYFRCSLCSNTIIPRFMFDKHVAEHRDSSESYELDYQCPCGYIYSLSSAFRAHVQHCNKKGFLPSHWNFLHKKVKAPDAIPSDNFSKEDNDFVDNSNVDSHIKKLNLFKTSFKKNSVREINTDVRNTDFVAEDNVPLQSFFKNVKNNCINNKNSNIREPNVQINEKSIGSEQKMDAKMGEKKADNAENVNDSTSHQEEQNCKIEARDSNEPKIKSSETSNIQSKEEYPKETGPLDAVTLATEKGNQDEAGCTGNETPDSEANKIFYDHIPRDHLGYVIKTQVESNKKEFSEEESSEPSKFQKVQPVNCNLRFVTELDERTGVITTKKVADDDSEHDDCNIFKESDDLEDNDNTDFLNTVSKSYCNEKTKLKLGHSFTCPFCAVLFPKHGSTFQQFRLHMESYHPDAALNIPINSDDDEKCDKNTEEKGKTECKELKNTKIEVKVKDINNAKTTPLKNFKLSKKISDIKKKGEDENCTKTTQNDEENEKADRSTGSVVEKALEGNNKRNDSNEFSEKEEEKDNSTCWTLQLSVERKDVENEPNHFVNLEKASPIKTENCEEENKKTEKEFPSNNFPIVKSQVGKTKTYIKKPSSKINVEDEKAKSKEVQKVETSSESCALATKEKTKIYFEENLEEIYMKDEEKKKKSESELEKRSEVSENEKSEQMSLLTGKDCEVLKISTCSSVSSGKESRVLEGMDEGRYQTGEKIRRESEVWSEFYESLMLAEKLKKKKEKRQGLESEERKKSVVADYSSKRVVKKPKRYRESSESEFENSEMENSDSDVEFLLTNDFFNDFGVKEAEGEVDGSEDQVEKKQKLLNKLVNIDNKFLDYLFEIVNRKEKFFELYNRHSNLRASRYNQDLRSYRKKVLNGIKYRGKSQKLLRYQELMKKKETDVNGEKDPTYKDVAYHRLQKKISEFSSDGSKTMERKRGRPRKMVDPSKIKLRRRSDKEVSFIEKNFEREESDMSPSKRKRKLSSKLQYYKKINMAEEKDDFSSGQVITSKSGDSSKKFSCAVCKEVFPEIADFREHIVVHRMEENTYQCMECGECFVVRPSLEKHLHAFHKIKNTDKYITENQCSNFKKEMAETDSEPLKENQCKVCKDQFERAIDLTKHFRIHGMAFLKEFRKEPKTK